MKQNELKNKVDGIISTSSMKCLFYFSFSIATLKKNKFELDMKTKTHWTCVGK